MKKTSDLTYVVINDSEMDDSDNYMNKLLY